jgi:hypothetical protein
MHLPGRKFANFGLFLCICPVTLIFRVNEGKIAEAWEVYDEAGMWRQLGVLPPDAP